LMARVTTTQNTADRSLTVGFDNRGNMLLLDVSDPRGDPTALESRGMGLDMSAPHHLLFTAIGESSSVYVDGELVFDNVHVNERAGTFGIGLTSTSPMSRCDGRDVWVYAFD
jgi:hypothetical protein